METKTTFSYCLLQWIRAHKAQLAECGIDGKRSSGLEEDFTQFLFRFERTWRGASAALKQSPLQTMSDKERYQESRIGNYRYSRECLTREQLVALRHDIRELARRMRSQRLTDSSSWCYLGLLLLPAPSQQEGHTAAYEFYLENARRMDRSHAESHPHRAYRLEILPHEQGISCTLKTRIALDPSRATSNRHTENHLSYREASTLLPYPQGQNFSEWLQDATQNWRKLQVTLQTWFDKDKTLWPDDSLIRLQQTKALRDKLKRLLTPEELEMLRSSMALM